MSAAAAYFECARIGFVNNLAFRLRYYTGIFTYIIYVTVYYSIWTAVYRHSDQIKGYNLPQILTYVAVGWSMRSFYWNTIDQEMAYEVIEGKIATALLKPLSIQLMWLARAAGESAFRLVMLTAPTAIAVALIFPVLPPASALHLALFVPAVAGSFLLMGALNFMVGTCAIHLESILALIRAKLWLIELLSGVLLPMTFFPGWAQAILRWLPFEHIAFSPLQIYLGRVGPVEAFALLLIQWAWVAALAALGAVWWRRSIRQITIHGG